MINKKIRGLLILLFVIMIIPIVASYSSSFPQYAMPGFTGTGMSGGFSSFDDEACEAGQDFILQVNPMGCTPTIVRSDLLEEQNVPVFCPISATKINPLIDVEAIDYISFSDGEFPDEVAGIDYHPAKAALGGISSLSNQPILENIGYVVVVLKQQRNESAMPDFVQGNLTAHIKYDIKNAFGVGKASYVLPEIRDEDWSRQYKEFSFWNGKGYLRAENIDSDGAKISIYTDENTRLASVNLKEGQSSREIPMPGFYCMANLQIKLHDLQKPGTQAKLIVDSDIYNVVEGEGFLDNKCKVRDVTSNGLVQSVEISCDVDEGKPRFELRISPRVLLNAAGVGTKEYSIGDKIYDLPDKNKAVYLGYIGQNLKGDYFIVPYVSEANTAEEFRDSYAYRNLGEFVEATLYDKSTNPGANFLNRIGTSLGYAVGKTLLWASTGNYPSNWVYIEGSGSNWEEIEDVVLDDPITFIGFAGPIDYTLDSQTSEYFNSSISDYRRLANQFPNVEITQGIKEYYAEQGLTEAVGLAENLGQNNIKNQLAEEFLELYPDSDYARAVNSKIDEDYRNANSDVAVKSVLIDNRLKTIVFDGITVPKYDDYGAEIFVQGTNDDGSGWNHRFYATLETRNFLINEDYFQIKEINEDSIVILPSVQETKSAGDVARDYVSVSGKAKEIELNEFIANIGDRDYTIRVDKINLNRNAKVSVSPSIKNAGTDGEFSFRIGIEKRGIQLSPEQVKDKINSLNETIAELTDVSEALSETVKGLKAACLGTGLMLTVKNFMFGSGIESQARQTIMRSNGGWTDICEDAVANGKIGSRTVNYNSLDECYIKEADNIDNDVDLLADVMYDQNKDIKKIQKPHEKSSIGGTVVNEEEFVDDYIDEQVLDSLNNRGGELVDPNGKLENINIEKFSAILNKSSFDNNFFSTQQLRDIDLYSRILDSNPSEELRQIAEKELYSTVYSIQETSGLFGEKITLADRLGVDPNLVGFFKTQVDTKGLVYDGLTYENIKNSVSLGVESDTPIKILQTDKGEEYIVILNSGGTNVFSPQTDENKKPIVYNANGEKVTGDILDDIGKLYFEKRDEDSYKNKNVKPLVHYYETEPYKGMPAVVPFDIEDGWYAATRQSIPTFGGIKAYDDSGRISSFYLCNVGENGREQFNSGMGDDNCEMINLGIGQPYNQFAGLSENDAKKLVDRAIDAIEDASRQYKKGVKKVNIRGQTLSVGEPATNVPEVQCQDFMSPSDCNLLFNVCDPVVCPPSRCNLGGNYHVSDVIQTGIVGGVMMCLPNIREQIYIPLCLSGINAGVEGLLSVLQGYQSCLQENLETGQTVGICDEIHSIYLCELGWRQAIPFANLAIPKLLEAFTGQNVRGGGEYLSIMSAWENAESSVNYMTNYYAANTFEAFKARTTEEAGTEVCQVFISGRYPTTGEAIDSLLEPDSPSQFHAWFDEIPFTSATVPPTSQYKVFYHIYAGKDQGAYYRVYLKSPAGTSFFQDAGTKVVSTGYIKRGEYVDETQDFTAPSGYQELCISVNTQEECGFKQVTTDFALNYFNNAYLEEQAGQKDVRSEKECISGTGSVYSLFKPNVGEGVDEVLNPELYNYGITRVCATDSPGKGTDASWQDPDDARWVDVGYCGEENIRCWLDTNSVKDVMDIEYMEENALEQASENYLSILRQEGFTKTEADVASEIQEFEKVVGRETSDDFVKIKTTLKDVVEEINVLYEKVISINQRANLLILKARAYYRLASLSDKGEIDSE